MGFLETLTIIFIVLKLVGVITWSWWVVLIPIYPAILIWILLFSMYGIAIFGTILEVMGDVFGR